MRAANLLTDGAGGVISEIKQKQDVVARLLEELEGGREEALDQLFAILYDELKAMAGRYRRRWRGNYTLNTTALVHEAYLKLLGQARLEVESQAHFHALVARSMRHILCNYARDRTAQKRGGRAEALPINELGTIPDQVEFSEQQSEMLLALDEALERLEKVNPRQSQVVECRFFGGLTIEETATALGTSPRTVKRDWAVAQAWLHREMGPEA